MSKELFELVKSLEKEEKRNFKLIASQVEGKLGNSYSYLFDLINKSNVYEEEQIYEKFIAKFSDKIYNYTKHYLKKKIIESLIIKSRGDQGEIVFTIEYYLDCAKLLFSKGLSILGIKELEKAESLALASEAWVHLQRIYASQLNTYKKYYLYDKRGINVELFTLKVQQIKKFEELTLERNRLETLLERAKFILGKNSIAAEIAQPLIAEIEHVPLPSTPYHQFIYFYVLTLQHIHLGDLLRAKESGWNALIQMDSAELQSCYYENYLDLLKELVEVNCELRDWSAVDELHKKIQFTERILFTNKIVSPQNIDIIKYENFSLLMYFHAMGSYSKVLERSETTIKMLDYPNLNTSNAEKAKYYYILANASFELSQFRPSQQILEQVFSNLGVEDSLDLEYFTKIHVLYLLVLFELKNFELAQSHIIVLKKKIKKNGYKTEVLSGFLKLIEKLTDKLSSPAKLEDEIKSLQSNIENNPNEKTFINLGKWLASIDQRKINTPKTLKKPEVN